MRPRLLQHLPRRWPSPTRPIRLVVGLYTSPAGVKLVQSWCKAGVKLVQSWCKAGVKLVQSWCKAGVNWCKAGVKLV